VSAEGLDACGLKWGATFTLVWNRTAHKDMEGSATRPAPLLQVSLFGTGFKPAIGAVGPGAGAVARDVSVGAVVLITGDIHRPHKMLEWPIDYP
jgi:hypothetical protein